MSATFLLAVAHRASDTDDEHGICALLAHSHIDCAVIEVFTSKDLLQYIVARMAFTDVQAPCVCKDWNAAWTATDSMRRGLRPIKPELDFEAGGCAKLAAFPDGDRLCVFDCDGQSCDIYKGMGDPYALSEYELEHDLDHLVGPLEWFAHCAAVSNDSLFLALSGREFRPSAFPLRRFDLDDFSLAAEVMLPLSGPSVRCTAMAVASNDLIFAATNHYSLLSQFDALDYVTAFDAHTLQERFRFRLPELSGGLRIRGATGGGRTCAMALVNDELYISGAKTAALHVFSLGGQHLREVNGEWLSPERIHFANDRIFLCETQTSLREAKKGARIVVITPQGQTLQVYNLPNGTPSTLIDIAVVGGTMVASTDYDDGLRCLQALKGV